MRQRVGERRARHVGAQDPRGDPGHDLGREAERLGVERRVALGLGAERVELGREVAVHAVGLQQRDGGLDGLQQRVVGRPADVGLAPGGLGAGRGGGRWGGAGRLRRLRGGPSGAPRCSKSGS